MISTFRHKRYFLHFWSLYCFLIANFAQHFAAPITNVTLTTAAVAVAPVQQSDVKVVQGGKTANELVAAANMSEKAKTTPKDPNLVPKPVSLKEPKTVVPNVGAVTKVSPTVKTTQIPGKVIQTKTSTIAGVVTSKSPLVNDQYEPTGPTASEGDDYVDPDDGKPQQPPADDSSDNDGKADSIVEKKKANQSDQAPDSKIDFDNSEDSHFLLYFIVAIIVVAIVYIVLHNKKKILGLILEGRAPSSTSVNRRPGIRYRKLDAKDGDAVVPLKESGNVIY
jgi:hypothetical protein